MGDEIIQEVNNPIDASDVTAIAHLLKHIKQPQNLLVYMIFTAWMKFMGVAEHIPSITIG